MYVVVEKDVGGCSAGRGILRSGRDEQSENRHQLEVQPEHGLHGHQDAECEHPAGVAGAAGGGSLLLQRPWNRYTAC